jgi:hypothetical protein
MEYDMVILGQAINMAGNTGRSCLKFIFTEKFKRTAYKY